MERIQIGDNLQRARKRKGLTQGDVATTLGVGQTTVSAWEANKTQPSLDYLLKLSQLYGVSMDTLCGATKNAQAAALTKLDILRIIQELDRIGIVDIWVDHNEYKRADIGFPKKETLSWLFDFYLKRAQLSDLCKDGTLDKSVLEDWIAQQYERLSKETIEEK